MPHSSPVTLVWAVDASRSSQQRCCCRAASLFRVRRRRSSRPDSELVVLHVTVKDRKGAYVAGLPRDAFNVIEDGRAQTVRLLTDTDTPVTVGLLIDSSAQHAPHRHLVIAGAAAFARRAILATKSLRSRSTKTSPPALSPSAPFTSDSTVLRSRARTQRQRPGTHGALRRDLDRRRLPVAWQPRAQSAHRAERWRRQRQPGDAGRGRPQGAGVKRGHLHDCPRRPGVSRRESELLKELAQASGGQSFRPTSPRIAEALGQIARDIRHTYTVGYTPTNTARDGTFRSVRVVVTAPQGRPLVVRSRRGYRGWNDEVPR